MPVSNGPKYSFGGKPRDRHMLDDSAPGPGKYFSSVPTMMGKEGPKFSVKGKPRDYSKKVTDTTPGMHKVH